jgi:hypothetical protein
VERSVRIRDGSVESWEPRIGIAAATARFRYLRRRKRFLTFDLLFLVCLLSGVLAQSAVGVLLAFGFFALACITAVGLVQSQRQSWKLARSHLSIDARLRDVPPIQSTEAFDRWMAERRRT